LKFLTIPCTRLNTNKKVEKKFGGLIVIAIFALPKQTRSSYKIMRK
jgi:hypothetical protein